MAKVAKKKKPAAKAKAVKAVNVEKAEPKISKSAKADMEMEAALVARLVKAREKNGMTQEQLATLVGMKQSAVARLESLGARPRIDTMIKLLKPLGYTLAVVLLGEEKEVVKRRPEKIEEKHVMKPAKPAVEEKQPEPKPETPQRPSGGGHKGIQLPRR